MIASARIYGDLAQLAEHLLCKQGVRGSIPLVSTTGGKRPVRNGRSFLFKPNCIDWYDQPRGNMHENKRSISKMRKQLRSAKGLLVGASIIVIALIAPTGYSAAGAEREISISEQSIQSSLSSKYSYFMKNNTLVIKAILLTRCQPTGYSFNWRDGAAIWVSQTKKYSQNGVSMFPTIEYRKATSSKGTFELRPGGESKLWWTKKWGCPVNGTWNTYGTKVTMTTQQLIDAGY